MLVGRWDNGTPPALEDQEIVEHLKNDWRPPLPFGILATIHYMGCFPDIGPDSMLNSLRPMIYTYWS
jgi:hypothetical protein